MSSADPLATIIAELERAAIPHMLAGSFASTYHGDPRTTHDIDLVIDPERSSLDALVRQLDPKHFYISPEAVDEAWRCRGQFNVVLMDSGWKVDLILRKNRPFSREEFRRRIRTQIGGIAIHVATAEDTILAKLEWGVAGESERQLRDVVGIVQMRKGELDVGYIDHWAPELGVEELWQEVQRRQNGA
jgi:hypothetical protein